MELAAREEKGNLVVEVLVEELNFEIGEEFKNEVLALFNSSPSKRLILDMGKVGFIDSKAIGAMVSVRKSIVREGGAMALCQLQTYVKKIISVVTLNTIFDVFETEKEALAG